MTGGEERIMYSCISLMIFALAAGFVCGVYLPQKLWEVSEGEIYFVRESAVIYTMSVECISEADTDRKRVLIERLSRKVDEYNSKAALVKNWTYPCKRYFTVDYLLKYREVWNETVSGCD